MKILNKAEWPELPNLENLVRALADKMIVKEANEFKRARELEKEWHSLEEMEDEIYCDLEEKS